MPPAKRLLVRAFIVALALILLAYGLGPFVAWGPLQSVLSRLPGYECHATLLAWRAVRWRRESIDIKAGRQRYERYIWCIRVADSVEETEISKVYRELIGEPPPPDWRTVNTFYGRRSISPHHRYHGAFGSAEWLTMSFGGTQFTDAARRSAVTELLRLLQTSGDYSAAHEYAVAVNDLACDWELQGRKGPIDVGDLPKGPGHPADLGKATVTGQGS